MDQVKHNLVWPTFRVSQNIYLYSLLPLHTVQSNGFYRCALYKPHPSQLNIYTALWTLVWSFPSGKYIPALACRGVEADFFGLGCSVPIPDTAEGKSKLLYRQRVPAGMSPWKMARVGFAVPSTQRSSPRTRYYFSAAGCLNLVIRKSLADVNLKLQDGTWQNVTTNPQKTVRSHFNNELAALDGGQLTKAPGY